MKAPIALTLALALTAVGCKSSSSPSKAPQGPTLALQSDHATTSQVVLATIANASLPTQLTGTLGSASVTLLPVDPTTVAFLVPEGLNGTLSLQVTVEGTPLSATLQVSPGPQVADPGAYVDAAWSSAEAELNALADAYADPSGQPPLYDAAQFASDRQTMAAVLADARDQRASATPEQLAALANLLAANADLLGLSADGATPQARAPHLAAAITDDGACLSETGTALDSYELCNAAFQVFNQVNTLRLRAMAGLTVLAWLDAGSGVGILLGVGTAYVLYKELARIHDETLRRFVDPVFAKLRHPSTYLKSGPSLRVAAASVPIGSDGQPFSIDTPTPYVVYANYHSVSRFDAAALSPLIATLTAYEAAVNKLRDLFLLSPNPELIPDTPLEVVFAPVPARFLSLGTIETAGVTGAAQGSGAQWLLTFSKDGLSGTFPFSFDVVYTPPDVPSQTMTVSGLLVALHFEEGTISGGYEHACGLDATGAAWCWGRNSAGQLGDETNQDSAVPVKVHGRLTFVQVTAGNVESCGLTAGGKAYCWGDNQEGTLGDGTDVTSWAPVAVAGGLTFTSITAGKDGHVCGLTVDHLGYCWGSNAWFAVGDGAIPCGQCMNTLPHRSAPVPVAGGLQFKAISAGYGHTCALTLDGAAWCWGAQDEGQVGDGVACTLCKTSSPQPVQGGLTFASIAAGGEITLALDAEGYPYEWGHYSLEPFSPPDVVPYKEVAAGIYTSCGIQPDGRVLCWGDNPDGLFGDGTIGQQYSSGSPNSSDAPFRSIAIGGHFALALDPDGQAFGWGTNSAGVLGDPAAVPQALTPIAVAPSVQFE